MKKCLIVSQLTLAGCMSTNDDPVNKQADWMQSDSYLECKVDENKALASYKRLKRIHDQKSKEYDYDSELRVFEKQMLEFESGTRKFMPLRPSVIGPAGLGPMLPKVGECFEVPAGWEPD